METLTRRKDVADIFHSSPSRALTGLNCRASITQSGILPSPSFDDQCDSKQRARPDTLHSSPLRTLTGLNSRAYEAGIGILPSPSIQSKPINIKSASLKDDSKSRAGRDIFLSPYPRTGLGLNSQVYDACIQSDPINIKSASFENNQCDPKSRARSDILYSSPLRTVVGLNSLAHKTRSGPINVPTSFEYDQCISELWAGPAYSSSPPPSSLPMPSFSPRAVKSAPSSPEKPSYLSSAEFFIKTNTATKDLKRILNLDS